MDQNERFVHQQNYLFLVDYHPIGTNLKTSLKNNIVLVNGSFNITCSALANPPARYLFYKDQENVVNDTTGSNVSVITTSVSERRKQVNYSCTPFNEFGDGPTEELTLTVLCKYATSIAILCFTVLLKYYKPARENHLLKEKSLPLRDF